MRYLLFLFTVAPAIAMGSTLFEGYYRIEKKGQHVGYLVQRLSDDAKSGTKILVGYQRVKRGEREFYQEYRLEARAGSGQPVRCEHRSTDGAAPMDIATTFSKGGSPRSVWKDGVTKKVVKIETSPLAPMISGFLFYVADVPALKANVNYRYFAFTEERGRTDAGTVRLVDTKMAESKRVYQIVDDYMGEPVENFVNARGVPLGSRLAAEDYVAYWVPDRQAAVGLLEFPKTQIEQLFGKEPEGALNPWSALTEFRADVFIHDFRRSEGSRAPSAKNDPKPIALPKRKL